ncbi:MAG: molybdopterin molybdotransferase MoeA [Bacteroidota bacterium]|nr:molybdopterin molybdotransferase MoeA [Candidatus Kapabacteria bacterium]MDW8218927.1 molybdopterin molybdotransferase MoeA [Bacteroidota bacterium]
MVLEMPTNNNNYNARDSTMISVAEARRYVQAYTPEPRVVQKSILEAVGYVLACDSIAQEPSPRTTNSAMDGIAYAYSPECRVLTVVGESAAGKPFKGEVLHGQAITISTGAVVPESVDTVVPREDYVVNGSTVHIIQSVRPGQWIRHRGTEYSAGSCVLRAGTLIRPAHCALAAQLGLSHLAVWDAPRVALLASGQELVDASERCDLSDAQVYDTNTPMLQAAVRESGGNVCMVQRIPDELYASEQALQKAIECADIICTTGGVSVGEHDYIRRAAERLGFETVFWRVRQKPGKPFFFARRNRVLLFGLPGNPVSAYICFRYYVQPVIAAMRRYSSVWKTAKAVMGSSLVNRHGRAEFVRVRLTQESSGLVAEALNKQDSYMLTSLTEADGIVFLDADTAMDEGMQIEVMLF